MMNFGVAVLGAGASRRMGQPKLLLPWNSTTIVGRLLHVWTAVGATQIAVVCNREHESLLAELQRLQFKPQNCIFNPCPERGMFSSVQCAAEWDGWNSSVTHLVITLADQPHLRESTLSGLLMAAREQPEKIVQPARKARARHPVILPKADVQALARCDLDTMRDFLELRSADRLLVEMDDPGLDVDIDRPEDYELARGFQ
jgi:molybdenum cofactor cytidylyltransferase